MPRKWKRGATNVMQLSKFQNAVTRSMPDDAVVTGTLYDTNGVLVPDSARLMPFEPGYFNEEAGVDVIPAYRGYVPGAFALPDDEYDFIVTATWEGNAYVSEPERITVT